MKFTFLGTGGAFSRSHENFHNNVLIQTDSGKKLLIDCGGTALESLDELGVDPLDIDGVIVTHVHADHVGGLEELGFRGLFLGPKQKFDMYVPNLLVPSRAVVGYDSDVYPDLWYNCLKGGMVHIQDAEGNAVQADMDTYFNVHVSESPKDPIKVGGIKFIFVKTNHVPNKTSYGLVLESETGTTVFFSADSTSERTVDLEAFDIVFHDCMFMPRYPATVHTHFEEMVDLPESVRKRTYLMHYGNPDNAPEDLQGMRLARKHQTFEL